MTCINSSIGLVETNGFELYTKAVELKRCSLQLTTTESQKLEYEINVNNSNAVFGTKIMLG